VVLERLHLLADRRGRDMQFLGRLGEAEVARGGLEGTQCGERRKAARHG